MLLKLKSLAVVALAVGFVTVGCTDDEEAMVDPVEPSVAEEPAPAPDAPSDDFIPETIFFGFDDYTLNVEAEQKLQALGDHLKASQNAVVQVEGHCDERGSIEYNLALGERRAQSVKNYLTSLGVDPARLSTISYGEEKPSLEGHDESAWGQNRRAEFTLTNN